MALAHRDGDLGRLGIDVAVPVVVLGEEAAVRDADDLAVKRRDDAKVAVASPVSG